MTEALVLRGTMRAHTDVVTAIATPIDNSDMIVTASRDKSLIVWHLTKEDKTYGVPRRRLTGHSHFVQDVVLSSDGQFALSGSWDSELRLWDLASGTSSRRFVGHTKDVLSVAFSIDNRQIVSASRDRTIKLWNTLGECKYTIQDSDAHSDWVSCVRFSPNTLQPTIVSASWDRTVKVWNLSNCKLRNTLAGHGGYVNTVAVSPDGSLCASGGKDGVILLWDLAEGKKLYSLDAGSIIHALCFSPNRYWLCAATEQSIKIWDLESKSIVEDLKVDLKNEADATGGGGNPNKKKVGIRAPDSYSSGCPLKSFKFLKTKKFKTGSSYMKTGFLNTRTPWWDGSVIYGNNKKGMRRVRTYKEGKLKISEDGLLEHDEKGIPISGDVRNCWAGFTLLQALFVKEHNAVCDMLKVCYPDFDDEQLYRCARLVTSAVIAKIHTIDWTVELLKTDTLLAAMRINWYGFLGKRFKDLVGNNFGPILSGLVGIRKPRDHGVPYSLTEEFVSVYRMHSLLPEEIVLRNIKLTSRNEEDKCPPILEKVPMREMLGKEGERRLSKIGMEQMLVSMGYQSSGAVALWNYPTWMRHLIVHDINGEDRPDLVDMAVMEVYRDRERGVARYNEFRRNLLMIPISKWEDLTDDEDVIEALKEVYGDDVEKLDLIVGLHAEEKIKGFAISETAFFIFLMMASRRLEADRFFTTNFNSKTYTDKGLEWVNRTESLKDVIDRHFPEMTKKWMRSSSAFSVWDSISDPTNYIPLYLRPAS